MIAAFTSRFALQLLIVSVVFVGAIPIACGGDSDFSDPAVLKSCTEDALVALEKGAGIILPEPVPVILLTTQEAKIRRREYVAQLEDKTGMTAAVDFMADAMMSDRMLGRYLPDEKVIYVLENVLLDMAGGNEAQAMKMLFPVLAHELVHAYDDQVYDSVPDPAELGLLTEDPSALMDIHTRMSLLEGRASFASFLACEHAGVKPLPKPSMEQARNAVLLKSDGSLGMDVLSGLGNSVGRMKFMQYVYGWEFAERAYAYGGEPFFKHVFQRLPLSMEELEDFDLFVIRWAEEMEAELDAEDIDAEQATAPGPAEANDELNNRPAEG